MIVWASIITLAAGALASINDPSSLIVNVAELAGVVALFALVCAAEAFSVPKS